MASTNPTPTTEQLASGALSMEQVLLSIMKNQETISSTIGMLREDVYKLKISAPSPKKSISNTSQIPHQKLRNEAIPAHSQSEPPVSKVTTQNKPARFQKNQNHPQRILPHHSRLLSNIILCKCNLVLWDIAEKDAIPFAPVQETLVQFYFRFSNSKDLNNALKDCSKTPLLKNEADVQALAARKLQTVKLACRVSRIGALYQSYIQGALACLGCSRWSPNLAQNSKDLYNVACQILAIAAFQQAAAAGAFDNQNVNLAFIMQMGLLQKTYNHFVHYFMKAWYDKEAKLGGSVKAAGAKKSINKSRER
ncbi:hypothetical protein O181_116073, partial [Austropuccinia psidii MF-1]|nr:hypothetical protein [Austropuccinia psidii MF-1]